MRSVVKFLSGQKAGAIPFIFALFLTFSLNGQDPWSPLFNGKNFSGWKQVGDSALFIVLDSAIVLHQKANTREHTFLRTNEKYRNFILELDAKRDSQFYYGILFRAINAPDSAHVRLYGYQIKVDHIPTRNWTGGIYDDFGNTWNWLYPLTNNKAAQIALHPPGTWDHYRIEAIGNVIKTWVNGIEATHVKNKKYRKGYIALKIHFLGPNLDMEQPTGWIKNIKILNRNLKQYMLPMKIGISEIN